jgi:hypothetical protein
VAATKLEVSVAQVEEVIHQHQLYHAQWTFLRREVRGRTRAFRMPQGAICSKPHVASRLQRVACA